VTPPPNLADPDCEPSDEQFAELMRRAFAGIAEAHQRALQELNDRIVREGQEALRRWREQSCNPY
jgi:hypothetical protein